VALLLLSNYESTVIFGVQRRFIITSLSLQLRVTVQFLNCAVYGVDGYAVILWWFKTNAAFPAYKKKRGHDRSCIGGIDFSCICMTQCKKKVHIYIVDACLSSLFLLRDHGWREHRLVLGRDTFWGVIHLITNPKYCTTALGVIFVRIGGVQP
jgi:hypothetical protein